MSSIIDFHHEFLRTNLPWSWDIKLVYVVAFIGIVAFPQKNDQEVIVEMP
ncbi:MAG: hypothetical protein WC091_24365 [Sulfuricellaceae bacterium]